MLCISQPVTRSFTSWQNDKSRVRYRYRYGRALRRTGMPHSHNGNRTRMVESPVPWQKSGAKKLLTTDILDGKVTAGMKPKDVYSMHEEYKPYKYENFRNNLLALHKSLQKLQGFADADSVALAHDLQVRPRAANNPRGYPRWERSEAERLLKIDIDESKHLTMKPKELHQKRKEYQEFPLEVFRDHIYEEVRKRTVSLYWSTKKK